MQKSQKDIQSRILEKDHKTINNHSSRIASSLNQALSKSRPSSSNVKLTFHCYLQQKQAISGDRN